MTVNTRPYVLPNALKQLLQEAPQQLFLQLQTFTQRLLSHLKLPDAGSPHGLSKFSKTPNGVVLHYTADPSFHNVCRWFCSELSDSSAHFVVAKQKLAEFEPLEAGLPLVAALPCTIAMLRPIDSEAYHATWANAWAYGIEVVNTGEVRRVPADRNSYVWWPRKDPSSAEWTKPYAQPGEPWRIDGRYFESYPFPQLLCVAVLTRALMQHMGSHDLWAILGHECVQGVNTVGAKGHDKRDPSQAMPTHLIRQAVLDPDDGLQALFGYNSPQSLRQYRLDLYEKSVGPQISADLVGQPPSYIQKSYSMQKVFLAYLGYHVEDLHSDICAPSHNQSVRVFQTMMGLHADGVVGPTTAMALKHRFNDRFAPLLSLV